MQRSDATLLRLLGAFRLTVGARTVPLPLPAQRVLAFLALAGHPVDRAQLAGTLWLDSSEQHAAGSLRSALWRIRARVPGAVLEQERRLALSPGIALDVDEEAAWAERVRGPGPLEPDDLARAHEDLELLPDWYEDWVLIERERLLQWRLHALERLCERLVAAGRYATAIDVGLAALRHDPLRRSSHRAVIRAHLAEGNRTQALRQEALYRSLVTGSPPRPRSTAQSSA